MTSATSAGARKSTAWKSIWSIFASFILVFVLSLGTDQILHMLDVYPPWKKPMYDPKLNALALSYRILFDTLGSYVTARLAPYAPMRHAMIGAAIGFVLSLAGVIVSVKGNMGPVWYPIALALSTLLTAWLGASLFIRNSNVAETDALQPAH
ncbi:MAG: hypothetical protein H0U66_09610 [Gemmatimonadaceae bacterium]|nr:hypothetical protein [Gemmatimonadaceae bacterium]